MSTVVNLAALGANGFGIQGPAAGDEAGWSISAAGDVNGDGFDDFIIGAPFDGDGGTNAGSAYVIFGRAGNFASVDLANLSPNDGFWIRGDGAFDHAGQSVAGAGDVNGDGF